MPDRHSPPEPTSTQCSDHTELTWSGDGTERHGTACWYISMGGFGAKAVAEVDQDRCLNVHVWHDGQFPFTDDDEINPRSPLMLHHCDGNEFVRFGEFLNGLTNFQ